MCMNDDCKLDSAWFGIESTECLLSSVACSTGIALPIVPALEVQSNSEALDS